MTVQVNFGEKIWFKVTKIWFKKRLIVVLWRSATLPKTETVVRVANSPWTAGVSNNCRGSNEQ
jgi:hypothetical protein